MDSLFGRCKDFLVNLGLKLRPKSSRNRSILLYLFFVFISLLLWAFLTFNNNMTMEMKVRVVINCPEQVKFLSQVPDTLTVSATDRGTSFLRYLFGKDLIVRLSFDKYGLSDTNMFRVDAVALRREVQKAIGKHPLVQSVSPEHISLSFTTEPGKKVPVVADVELHPQLLCVQSGPITITPDSVMVYSDAKTLKELTEVYTYHINGNDLADTLQRKVNIQPLKGAAVEPNAVEVVVPVEKLVTGKKEIPVVVRNLPPGVKVLLFPAIVHATFSAPKSHKSQRDDITAVVDYNEIDLKRQKVAVRVGEAPAIYQSVFLDVDSLEFMIENVKRN